ncbi:protein prune, partial [Biomphalaria glabrata]
MDDFHTVLRLAINSKSVGVSGVLTKYKLGTFILPLLCLQREKFRLRLETVYFLRKHSILPEDLTFIDDLDLPALRQNEVITLTASLVDHHVLSPAEVCLKDCVVEVIDHRPLAEALPNSWNAQIEPVGSCSSLVAKKMLSSDDFTMESTVAELLLGTILCDTGNMSTSDNLATHVDHEVLVKLKSFLPPSISATSIYDEIKSFKFDLSSLTVSEMLHKDLKVLKGSQIVVAMSTITMNMQAILQRPEFSHDAADFCQTLPADVLIIMAFVSGDAGIQHRWIAVYSTNRVYKEQLIDVLLSSTNPHLDLEPLTLSYEISNLTVFIQNNLQASRKQVLPLVSSFLAGEITTPEENLNSSGQFAYAEAGDKGDNCEEETRRHINLAKTFQSDQFRTSQDRFDLAAVGAEALISPSLSSDSDLACQEGETDAERDAKEMEEVEDAQLLGQVLNQSGAGDFFTSPPKQTNKPELMDSLINFDEAFSSGQDRVSAETLDLLSGIGISDRLMMDDSMQSLVPLSNGDIQFTSSDQSNVGETILAEDVLQNHTPFDLLCPTNVDSPLDISSMPTSGQASGQGSKVPSYPDTPPNSYMEASGVVYLKETQLPSFNSSEMVKRIHAKKAALAGHTGVKDLRYDNIEDDDSFDLLSVGGLGGGSSGGSLISPAVPQNSYMDLTTSYDQQIPKLANSDILERVIEKRSQFEWNVETLDGSAANTADFIPPHKVQVEPFTPQNSYIEGNFDTYARNNLPSINNAESVAKIRAKQSAMFGGSGCSSDDSGGCQSPDIGGKSPKIPSPYTPQNSYRDSLQLLENRNMMPDLNEVVERLSVEHSSKGQFVGGTREDEHVGTSPQNHVKPTRHSSSQSDSQNTMSDVDSLMSVSTDVGTPSENIVANSLAGLMRTEISMLSRKDTNDSEVFGPVGKSEENISSNNDAKRTDFSKFNHVGSPPKVTLMSGKGERKVGFEDKDLFSPVEEGQLRTVEDHAFYEAAESIVAQSVAAALQASKREDGDDRAGAGTGGRLRWTDNTVLNFIEDEDCEENSVEAMPVEPDEDSNDRSVSDDDQLNDITNSNAQNYDGPMTSHDSLQIESDVDAPGPSDESPSSEEMFIIRALDSDPIQSDDSLMEIALKELAYEFANELIQSVLNNFPFNEEEKANNKSTRFFLEDVEDSDQPDFVPFNKTNSSDRSASFDSNASTVSVSERKRSRGETDTSMVIVEGEVTTSFPERKSSAEDVSGNAELVSKSFPYRKFSKSEDFPSRRFSREESSSRRSSRLDDAEYDNSIKREDLETDYLPNMDPLQGNLDIIDASYSKITDVDREVVEGESFRKASSERLHSYAKEIEANNNGLHSSGGQMAEEDETLSEEAFRKMATKSKRKIRVSFSEDFDDDVGDFNIQASSRPQLKSPPPPIQSQDSISSSPPSQELLESDDLPQTLVTPEETCDKAEKSDGEDGVEESTPTSNALHEQVGKMIESAEETLAEADRDLDFFSSAHSLPSLASPALASSDKLLPANATVPTVVNVSDGPLFDPVGHDLTLTSSKNPQPASAGDFQDVPAKVSAVPAFADPLHTHSRNLSSTSFGSIKGAVYTEEWQDDEIVEMAAQSGLDAPALDSSRKKIVPDSSCLQAITDDGDDGVGSDEEEETESESGDLEWE